MIVGAIAKAMENSQWMKRMILGKRRHFEIDNGKARQDLDASSCFSLSLAGLKGFREKLSIGQ